MSIFWTVNRNVPRLEINGVADFLRNLLTAEVEKLPTPTLVHHFWTYFSNWHRHTLHFRVCLRKDDLIKIKCYSITSNYCGKRFGTKPPERIEQCRRLIANEINMTTAGLTPRVARIFNDHHSCLQSCRQRVDAHCTELLRKAIADHRLRATKVIRATMDSMRPLLLALPNLRIIHLVRDPRAVALSA